MDSSSRIYHHLNLFLAPTSSTNHHSLIPKSPFRFGNGTTSKTTDDERLALIDRFRQEGLDVRKLNDAQKLPFVWRWMVDAEINCQSLRHQIEKMRIQHEEEIQEVEDYIEQVWKLSTERLILLEEENKSLRDNNAKQLQLNERRYSKENNNLDNENMTSFNEDDDCDEDSDIELEKCLYGTRTTCRRKPNLVNNLNDSKNGNGQNIFMPRTNQMVNSSSISYIAASNSKCDNLTNKLRTSRSCWQLGTFNHDCEKTELARKLPITTTSKDNHCERCEQLELEIEEMKQRILELEIALEDANEKYFIIDKLNRNIEIENETFAYKLSETEERSNQMERRIRQLDRECCQLKSSQSSNQLLVNPSDTNDQSIKRLIDELNHKVKTLEEALDHREQMYEELEIKYEKQKVKQHETLWKLRKFVQDKVNTDNDCIDHCRHDAEMYLTNASIHLLDDLDSEDNKTFTISSSNDSGMITMDPIRFNQNHSNHNHM